MKVQILDEAKQDVLDGYRFYSRQAEELGNYFLEPLTKPKSETFGRRFRRGQRPAPNGFVSGS